MDRRLIWPLAISLLVHGLALLRPPFSPSLQSTSSLQATLRQPRAPAPGPEKPAPAVTAPETPVMAREEIQPREPVERTYEKKPAPSGSESPSPATEPETGAAAGPALDTPTTAAAPTETVPPQPKRTTVDSTALTQYYMAVSRMASRYKKQNPERAYPRQAKDAGWEGRVSIRLSVSEAGAPTGLSVINSSGHPMLDQAAMTMLGVAASHTPVPESLLGRPFNIDLVVNFNLQEED